VLARITEKISLFQNLTNKQTKQNKKFTVII